MSIGVVASHGVIAAAGSPYDISVLSKAPTAYWHHNDPVGSTSALDGSGNAHTGVYSGSVTLGAAGLVTGDSDTCADFSAGNSGAAGAAWMSSPAAVTFEAVIKPSSVSAGSYNFIAVRDDNNGTGNLWWLVLKATKLTALCRGVEFSGTTTILANNKYHVAFTYDSVAATAKLFVNGAQDASVVRSGAMNTANLDLLIGRWGNAGSPLYFAGKIAKSAYWNNVALTPAQIAADAALV